MTHYPATCFAVREPAPDYRPAPRWGTLLWCAVGMALVLLGSYVEFIQ